jgi:hypothetical protein
MKYFIFTMILAMAIIAACSEGWRPPPNMTDADLYDIKCSRCHELYDPTYLSDADWEFRLDRELKRANLTLSERTRIADYLKANNKRD